MNRAEPQPTEESWQLAAADLDATASPPSDGELGVMLATIQARVAKEDRGLHGWLRARSTRLRRGLAMLALALPGLHVLASGTRGDWSELGMSYLIASTLSLAAAAAGCAWLSMRPLQQAALPHGTAAGVFAVGVLGLIAVALWGAHDEPMSTVALIRGMAACASSGIAMVTPLLLLAHLADRGSLSAPVLTVTSAALLANAWLVLKCPIGDLTHCLGGHVSIALWLLLGITAARRLT